MGELRLHAISVYQVRDMFGALPELAAELRTIASQQFAVPVTEQQLRPSLINRLAPLRRQDPQQILYPPGHPTPRDWEALIEGRHIEPDRLDPCWRIVDAWVETRDRGTATFPMTPAEVEAFDFSLTKAGLPAHLGLRNLLANDLAIPLRPAHGMRVGYAKNAHVLATADALRRILPQVEEAPGGPARYLSSYLDAFCGWTEEARRADQLLPDLVVVWWQTARADLETGTPPQTTGPRPRMQGFASLDPSQPIVTGRSARKQAPAPVFDPTQPIITGRQARKS